MTDFFDLDPHDLELLLKEEQVPLIHKKTILGQAYKKSQDNPWQAPTLPKKLHRFQDRWPSTSLKIALLKESPYDGAVKFLFALKDGTQIESVLMPEASRITLCLSSQVGCAQGCAFCHTGRMGLKRHLTPGEIVAQVVSANRWIEENPTWLEKTRLPPYQRITNLVFMGMGEPMDNLSAVLKAIRIFIHPYALGLAAKKITVSTAGHLDGIKELLAADLGVGLALSLHETSQALRSRLMPINRRFPLEEILIYLKETYRDRKDKVMIQYTLIRGVNDSQDQAHKLADLLVDLPVKVNLIPYNEIEPSSFQGPDPAALEAFAGILYQSGIQTMVRFSKGQDIHGACGQLVV
jgi:23S rRNA (adenine2503-C2)-methyltransferase